MVRASWPHRGLYPGANEGRTQLCVPERAVSMARDLLYGGMVSRHTRLEPTKLPTLYSIFIFESHA